MEKPFRTQTQKRQTSFFVASIAFLSIYIFNIEVTSLADLGLKTTLRAEFVRTVLFWASVLLFVLYALDVVSELTFFTWHRSWQGEASKWHRIMTKNSEAMNLLKAPACEFTVRKLAENNGNNFNGINEQLSRLCSRLNGTLHNKKNGIPEADRLPTAIGIAEDARLQMLSYSRYMWWASLWRLFRLGIGIPPFIGYLVFDVALPIAVICTVVSVAYGDADWIRYENLSWFWISDPDAVTPAP